MDSGASYRAYYSAKQAEHTGTHIYKLKDGSEVECTTVGTEPPGWLDAVDLGETLDTIDRGYVRRGRLGDLGHEMEWRQERWMY